MSMNSRSIEPVPFNKVRIQDSFWVRHIRTIKDETIMSQYEKLVETGRIDAFRLDWKPGMEPVPHVYWDSDVAKWVEAACYILMLYPDPRIESAMNQVVDLIISAQQPDGYINTYYTVVEPEKRWTNLLYNHELYCAGHLIEAAVAHHRLTGKRNFIDAVCRYADYIDSVFGTEPGKKRGYCGHEEIELALFKLYEVTHNERYFELGRYFLEERGRQPYYFNQESIVRGEEPDEALYVQLQADKPIREQTTIQGHAVRAMYCYAGATDLAAMQRDEELFRVLAGIWDNLTTKKMYLTGGIGQSHQTEGFKAEYDLANDTAYAETCAAVGLIFWSHRMLQSDLDARYADVVERALYNGSISGISLAGNKYFYVNPLESAGSHHRSDWYGCSCCPSNIARLIASVGSYIYSQSDTAIMIHQYIGSEADLEVGGEHVRLKQVTNYPWEGDVDITVHVDHLSRFGIKMRIPGWCSHAVVSVNGNPIDMGPVQHGYLEIDREWRGGDSIHLSMRMEVKRIYAHPRVVQDLGRVAIQRGPLVYCLEEADNPVPQGSILILDSTQFDTAFEPELFGGVATITGEAAFINDADWNGDLYHDYPPTTTSCKIKAIPYYAWDNRSPGWMSVWIRNESTR